MRNIWRWLVVVLLGSLASWSPAVQLATATPVFQASESPSPEPTSEPTAAPTPEPTAEPSPEPTLEPSEEPTIAPSEGPSSAAGAGSGGDAGGTSDETPVAWWQWLLLALLLVGGLAAMAFARRRPPSRIEVGQRREVLLAQIQRLATRSSEVAATDDEIGYQRATVEALMPLLRVEVERERDPQARRGLEGVTGVLAGLGRALKSARGTALRSEERARVHEVAAELDERLAGVRSETSDADGAGP
jgi:hypothetical protein